MREVRVARSPARRTLARIPSSLRSKIHPGSSKGRSVSVAFIGSTALAIAAGYPPPAAILRRGP